MHKISFPSGEASKSRDAKALIEDRMFELGLGEDSLILAVGGGVTLDLAGYVAASYLHGIPYIKIPTTLLAQAEMAVGGKTGIHAPAGRNLLGAFHPPFGSWVDIKLLENLPDDEWANGWAEIIRHAIVGDALLFERLERLTNQSARKQPDLKKLIYYSLAVKARFVATEKLGENHAALQIGLPTSRILQRALNYTITRAEAVALGILVECRIAVEKNILDTESFARIRGVMANFLLPECWEPVPGELLSRTIEADRQWVDNRIRLCLPNGIGLMHEDCQPEIIRESDVLKAWEYIAPRPTHSGVRHLGKAIEMMVAPSRGETLDMITCAALADGPSLIYGPLDSLQTAELRVALRELGVRVESEGFAWRLIPPEVLESSEEIEIEHGGSVLRQLASLSLVVKGGMQLHLGPSLVHRPLAGLLMTLEALGVRISRSGEHNEKIHFIVDNRPPKSTGIDTSDNDNLAAGLVLMAPILKDGLTLHLLGGSAYSPYIESTLKVMETFGVPVDRPDRQTLVVPHGRYHSGEYKVGFDDSIAAMLIYTGWLLGKEINLLNVDENLGPRCRRIRKWIEEMNILQPHHVDAAEIPSLLPLLFTSALFSGQSTIFEKIRGLSARDTDRLREMATQYGRMGASIDIGTENIVVHPVELQPNLVLDPGKDDKQALLFRLVSLRVPGTRVDTTKCKHVLYHNGWVNLGKLKG